MADKELHSQIVALGHQDVRFALGTAASLDNGSILWNGRDKPSNLSFFTLYKNNPFSDTQTSQYMSLNILSLNIDNKNMDEIIALQKQTVTVPNDFNKMLNVIEMYKGLTSILFRKESAL
jgi:hypothetical protein